MKISVYKKLSSLPGVRSITYKTTYLAYGGYLLVDRRLPILQNLSPYVHVPSVCGPNETKYHFPFIYSFNEHYLKTYYVSGNK